MHERVPAAFFSLPGVNWLKVGRLWRRLYVHSYTLCSAGASELALRDRVQVAADLRGQLASRIRPFQDLAESPVPAGMHCYLLQQYLLGIGN